MKTKRPFAGFTAALVAVCMMLQFIPAFGSMPTAQALEVGESFTITFNNNAWNSGASADYTIPTAKMDVHGWELDRENTTIDPATMTSSFWTQAVAKYTKAGDTLGLKVNVPEDGYYKLTFTCSPYWTYSDKAYVAINGENIGDVKMNSSVEGTKELGLVNLKEGVASVVFTANRYDASNCNSLAVQSLEFTKVGEYQEEVTGPIISFDGYNDINALKAKKITSESPWEFDSTKSSAGENVRMGTEGTVGGVAEKHNTMGFYFNYPAGRLATVFNVEIADAGVYDLSTCFCFGEGFNYRDADFKFYIDGVQVNQTGLSVGEVSGGPNAALIRTWQTYDLGQVSLKAGKHTLTLMGRHSDTNDNYYGSLKSISFDKVGELDYTSAQVNANFSESYAYVRESYAKDVTVYDFIFIGGIDTIDNYKKVGFEYSTDGGATWNEALSDKVYTSLEFSDGNLANTDFGTEYIFYNNAEITPANIEESVGTVITFRACAVDNDNNKIYGAEYAVSVNK